MSEPKEASLSRMSRALEGARLKYGRALKSRDHNEILSTSIEVAFKSAAVLALKNGVPSAASRTSVVATAEVMNLACSQYLRDQGENYEVGWARDMFGAVAELQGALNGPPADTLTNLATIAALSLDLGQKIAIGAMGVDGVWEAYARADVARTGLSKGGKNKRPLWEREFAPTARAYCRDKQRVSLGQLVSLAQRELRSGRLSGLPTTKTGIKQGLKRLERSGELSIPGRPIKG